MRYKSCLLVIFLFTCFCTKNGVGPEEPDPLRYQFPDYPNGSVVFMHSFYHDCDDDEYWSQQFRSKQFSVNDFVFVSFSEMMYKDMTPNLTLEEKAEVTCSNGDQERITFNLPYPPCITHIPELLPMFGAISTKKGNVQKNNNCLDVQQDTIQVIAHYKSYWTGNVVRDTAYVAP